MYRNKNFHTCLLIVVHCLMATVMSDDGTFIAMAPSVILPMSNFTIFVRSLDATSPKHIKCFILCETHNSVERVLEFKSSGTSQSPSLVAWTGDITQNNFKSCELIAANSSTETIYGRKPLTISEIASNSFSNIFIQMDKPVYKPGDQMRIRLVILDARNLPTRNVPFTLVVRDAHGIIVDKVSWDPLSFSVQQSLEEIRIDSNHLFNYSFPLAKILNLGEWKLTIEGSNFRREQIFLVEKYVLPKFYIEFILDPKFVTLAEPYFALEIKSAYTYGEPVDGIVSVVLQHVGFKSLRPETVNLRNGKGIFHFDISRIVRDKTISPSSIFLLEANVTEANTLRVQYSKFQLPVFKSTPYKITWLNPATFVKPGIAFDIRLAVSDFENYPVVDLEEDAIRFVAHGTENGIEFIYSNYSAIGYTGIVTTSINPTVGTVYTKLEVFYKDVQIELDIPKPLTSESVSFLNLIRSDNNEPSRGEEIEFSLQTSANILNNVNYILWNGQEIVDAVSGISVTNGSDLSNTGVLKISLSRNFHYYARLTVVVYFSSKSSAGEPEIFTARATIPTQNKVRVSFSNDKIEPRQSVTLNIESHLGSTVALRGIDQSLLLLSRDCHNNDVDPRSVPYNPFHVEPTGFQMDGDPFAEFTALGIYVITDSSIQQKKFSNDGSTVRRKKRYTDDVDSVDRPGGPLTSFFGGEIITRDNFPEIWFWKTIKMNEPNITLSARDVPIVPDELTTWYVTAISVNSLTGFAVSAVPALLQVFRPFFITLNLPYAINKGTIFELQVIVHNYLDHRVQAAVAFNNSKNEFSFVDTTERLSGNIVTKYVTVDSESVNNVTFVISAVDVGNIDLCLSALADVAGDSIRQTIRVVPEGEFQWTKTLPIVFHNQNSSGVSRVNITTSRRKRETYRISFSQTPLQFAAPSKTGLLKPLIFLPTDCGEQRMVKFLPHAMMLDYITSIKVPSEEEKFILRNNLQMGYTHQMTFYNSRTGAFRLFSNNNPESTWLTAFVLRSFAVAKKHITIDNSIFSNGIRYICSQQQNTGRFYEHGGKLGVRYGITGGLAQHADESGYGLTADITLALMEIGDAVHGELTMRDKITLNQCKENGLKYIGSLGSELETNLYNLLVITATLHAAKHNKMNTFYEKIESFAMNTTAPDGSIMTKWWQFDQDGTPKSDAITVEMTSFGLLIYLWRSQETIAKSAPIANWLYRQRTAEGGFYSSQDTVVALKALVKYHYATRAGFSGTDPVNISLTTSNNKTVGVQIDEQKDIHVKSFYFHSTKKRSVDWITIEAKGKGRVLLDYAEGTENEIIIEEESVFHLEANLTSDATRKRIYHLNFCTHLNSTMRNITGQILVQIRLPFGFSFETKEILSLLDHRDEDDYENLSNIMFASVHEIKIWFSYLTNQNTCLSLEVFQSIPIAEPPNGKITVTDYYGPERTSTREINMDTKTTVCDICFNNNECDVLSGCASTR